MTLSHLRALLSAGSARPWHAEPKGAHGGSIYDSPDAGMVDKVAAVHCGGRCGTGRANLDIIVALVNNADKLLAVVEAAQALNRTLDINMGSREPRSMRGVWLKGSDDHAAIADTLRTALLALESQ